MTMISRKKPGLAFVRAGGCSSCVRCSWILEPQTGAQCRRGELSLSHCWVVLGLAIDKQGREFNMDKVNLAPSRWLRITPVVFIVYSVAIVDRANYGFGSAAGMAKDLGIADNANSLLGAVFFPGQFLFSDPGCTLCNPLQRQKTDLLEHGAVGTACCWHGNNHQSAAIVCRSVPTGSRRECCFSRHADFFSVIGSPKESGRAQTAS